MTDGTANGTATSEIGGCSAATDGTDFLSDHGWHGFNGLGRWKRPLSIAVGTSQDAPTVFDAHKKRTLEGSPIIGVGAPLQGAFILSFSLSAGSANLRLLRGDAFSVNPPLSLPIKGQGYG